MTIYSAVIMTKVIARVHSVHLVNVEQRQAAADVRIAPIPETVSDFIQGCVKYKNSISFPFAAENNLPFPLIPTCLMRCSDRPNLTDKSGSTLSLRFLYMTHFHLNADVVAVSVHCTPLTRIVDYWSSLVLFRCIGCSQLADLRRDRVEPWPLLLVWIDSVVLPVSV